MTTTFMYTGTAFESLKVGDKFKASRLSFMIYEKVTPAITPRQHNAVTINTRAVLYDWFDEDENILPHEAHNDSN